MNRLGIELLTAFGMPPLDYVNLAADLGCGHISTGLTPLPWNPCGFRPWSLREDPVLRREMIAAMRDRGVSISLAEGVGIVRPQVDIRKQDRDLDLMAELGAQRIGTVVMEPDLPRALDQLAALAEMSAARGMELCLEFAPPHPVGNLQAALAAIRHVAKPQVRLTIDAMHFFRSGGTIAELAALDPGLLGYAQLCDVPLLARDDDYMREASFERMIPGEGELPLREFLAVLPDHLLFGLEVPMLAALNAGTPLRTLAGRAVEAARRLLEQART